MSSPSSATSITPHLLDFMEFIEAREVHAKTVLKQQVDAILEDFFSQLVAEFKEMMKVVCKCSSVKSELPMPLQVESVVCEPIIEMCLMGEAKNKDHQQNSSSQQSSKKYQKISQNGYLELKSESDLEGDDISHGIKKNNNFNQAFQMAQQQLQQVSTIDDIPELRSPPPLPEQTSSLPSNDKDSTSWTCPSCDKKMKNERTLYMHQWRYHKVGQFRCTEAHCPFVASYRIQLRTHQIRFHDLGKFSCPFPGCGRSFNRRNSLKRHERIHLRLKPYRCRQCEYASELRSSMIDHVRVTHFRLPRSRKEQMEMSIGDDRNPADYFEVIEEGLDLLEPVLEHVSSVLGAQVNTPAMAFDHTGGVIENEESGHG